MQNNFQKKHDLWLEVLFASFAIENPVIKEMLYDFSMIEFRHMKWMAQAITEQGGSYNYERGFELYKKETVFEILRTLQSSLITMQTHYNNTPTCSRMITDEQYMAESLACLLKDPSNDAQITAFNGARRYGNKNLDQEQLDALTIFLFEESYKEYELILIYAYLQVQTDDLKAYTVFQDLVDESHFHLKSFANMMAKMGILALPRTVHEMSYKIDDIPGFITKGIAEEEAAKEQCLALSESIRDEELSMFFDFINYQESYHIALMQKLL